MVAAGLAFGGKIIIPSAHAFAVLAYLSFLSATAYSLWGVLLQFNPVSRVTIFSFCTPVFGVLLSNLMLSEKSNVPPLTLAVTLVLICAGIIILNYRKGGEK